MATQIDFGSFLRISVRHTYLRGTTFYFCRPAPKDLQGRVGCSTVKRNLQTSDPITAAKLVAQINGELESTWPCLRKDLKASIPPDALSWSIALSDSSVDNNSQCLSPSDNGIADVDSVGQELDRLAPRVVLSPDFPLL